MQILIGFEAEWIDRDPNVAQQRLELVLTKYSNTFDVWIGSVHHVGAHPIDYDQAGYARALKDYDNDEDNLFCAYFDAQYQLLSRLQPPIVGHFDLIRLKCSEPDKDLRTRKGVWERILRNLAKIREYGGVLEINSSALRKGLAHPYPRAEVVQQWNMMSGRIVLSDDSHGISQVATCYSQAITFLKDIGMKSVGAFKRDDKEASVTVIDIPLDDLMQHPFWTRSSR